MGPTKFFVIVEIVFVIVECNFVIVECVFVIIDVWVTGIISAEAVPGVNESNSLRRNIWSYYRNSTRSLVQIVYSLYSILF